MRTISIDGKTTELRELIEAARTEPVTVLIDGTPAGVMLSPEAFDRLDGQDRIRRGAKARLRGTIAAMQAEAAERGLSDSELERLLADES